MFDARKQSKDSAKVEKYGWVKPGDEGRYRKIPIEDLNIDHRYQREEVSNANTLSIAAKLNWSAFGVLVVMERSNGMLFIVDGQQRWHAAKRRGDIAKLPCLIFKSDGAKHEAIAFLDINTHRRYLRATKKFNAAVEAKRLPEVGINNWLESNKFVVNESKTPETVRFIDLFMRQWKYNTDAAKQALMQHYEIVGEELMHTHIQKGLFWLIHSGFDIGAYTKKLITKGGRTMLLRSIATTHIETLAPSLSDKTAGLGILKIINLHKRKKIRPKIGNDGSLFFQMS